MKLNRIWRVIIPVLFFAGLLLVTRSELALGQKDMTKPDVEPELQAQILRDNTVGYIIYMHEKANLAPAYDLNWEMRGEYVVKVLQVTAKSSQADIVKYLDEQNVDYQTFWIDNIIIVNSSNQYTFNGLMSFSEIESLKARRTMGVINPTVEVVPESVLAIEPNISHVLAPDVWGMGITGAGIVVANIDTGVRSTHEALVRQYRGTILGSHDFNWLGAAGGSTTPVDDHGHGTHTMGTIVGEDASQINQIGMAPGAQWIACDGCEGAGCPDAALLTCAQWITAPYPIGDPGSPNASMRPNVVNNSWGDCGTSYDNWFQASVDAWLAAGIYPIFSNGNASNCGYSSPPGLNTVGNPARYGNVTGVGSTGESNGAYANHSNWGPTDNLDFVNPKTGWENLKPQVLAPGVNIRSSTPGSDTQYQDGWTGTSMSAPHVTGLVALMWQAAPCLTGNYATTETILEETATPIPYDDGTGSGAHTPNFATGWGEINALAAVQDAIEICSGGTLEGRVRDAITSDPIEDAQISASLSITQTFSTITDSFGDFEMSLPAGAYTVTASSFGYLPSTAIAVSVISGMTTTLDFDMAPAILYQVSGTVTDATTGWPLYASIDIDGYPGEPIWSDPESGYYEVWLPEGVNYIFNVSAWAPGYLPASVDVGPLSSNIIEDVALGVDLANCIAPGYTEETIFYDGFESGNLIAGGWITKTTEVGRVRVSTEYPYSGDFSALLDTSIDGGPSSISGIVKPIDLSGEPQVYLDFWWREFGDENNAEDGVFLSDDGGSTWCQVFSFNNGPNSFINTIIDLSTAASNCGMNLGVNAQILFQFYDNYSIPTDGYAFDEVKLKAVEAGICNPPANGGLVVGNVYDENTLEPLNGSMVGNEDGYLTQTQATPLDEDVNDGFFSLFSPSGSKTFTATLDASYGSDVDQLDVLTGDTISHDFYLSAPSISVSPTEMEVTLVEGNSMTVPLELVNNGMWGTEFEIVETAGSVSVSIPASIGRTFSDALRQPAVGASPEMKLSVPMGLPTAANFDVLILTPDANVNDLVAALSAFSDLTVTVYAGDLSTLSAAELAGYDVVLTSNNTRWSASGADVSVGNALADYVDAGGKVIVNAFAYDWAGWQLAGRFITEQYGPFSSTSSDFAGTSTLGTIHDPSHPILNNVTSISNTYLWQNPGLNPGATLLAEWNDGSAFLAVNQNVVALNLLPSDGYGVPGWTGDLPTLYHNAVVWLTDSAIDLPWLSTDPITGTLAADSQETIDVTFDTMTYTVGVYTGALLVRSDDPVNNRLEVPVTMHVEAIGYGVELSAEDNTLSGEPGSFVTYTVWVTNSGNVPDSFDIAAGPHNWDMDMVSAVGPLEPAKSHSVEIVIAIPMDAGNGASDSVTISVSSQGNPAVTAEIILTTEAVIDEILMYMPLVSK